MILNHPLFYYASDTTALSTSESSLTCPVSGVTGIEWFTVNWKTSVSTPIMVDGIQFTAVENRLRIGNISGDHEAKYYCRANITNELPRQHPVGCLVVRGKIAGNY